MWESTGPRDDLGFDSNSEHPFLAQSHPLITLKNIGAFGTKKPFLFPYLRSKVPWFGYPLKTSLNPKTNITQMYYSSFHYPITTN